MKKLVTFAMLALVCAYAFAEKKVYTEEEKAALKEKRMQRTGGTICKEGEGKVVVVNAQKKYPVEDIERALEMFRDFLKVTIEVREGAWKFGDKKPDDANVAIYIVDDAALPMSLVAMEANWGVMNVAPLTGKRQFDNEFARVGIATMGAGVSQYKVSPMQPVAKAGDLDSIIKPAITMDSGMSMNNNLEKLGVTKSKMTTYLKACQEGWAPEPTNEYQKVIWEKVKAEQSESPSNPIRIKPGDKPKGK